MIDFGIIAAGDGARLKAEGSPVAKPLLELGGEPMIGRLISIMEDCGAASVSVIVNSNMPEVWKYLQELQATRQTEIKLLSAQTESSLHSFEALLKMMDPQDKFIVTTVDTVFDAFNFSRYVKFFEETPHDIDGVMGVSTHIDDESPLYVSTDEKNHIQGFEDTAQQGLKYVSAGVYGLRRNSLPIMKECVETGVSRMRNFQRALIEQGLNLLAFDLGKVIDIDHLSDLEKANLLSV